MSRPLCRLRSFLNLSFFVSIFSKKRDEMSDVRQTLKSKTGDYFKSFDTITKKIAVDTHESQ